jgi:hypothetical protein
MRDRRMRGRKIKGNERSAIGKRIRIADIMPNRSYIRSTGDITELYKIALQSSGGNLGWKK